MRDRILQAIYNTMISKMIVSVLSQLLVRILTFDTAGRRNCLVCKANSAISRDCVSCHRLEPMLKILGPIASMVMGLVYLQRSGRGAKAYVDMGRL